MLNLIDESTLTNRRWINVDWISRWPTSRRYFNIYQRWINIECLLGKDFERNWYDMKKFPKYQNNPCNNGKWHFHFTTFQCLKTHHREFHTSIPVKLPKFGLWNCKKLDVLKNYQNIRKTPPVLENGTFIQLYSEVPNHPDWANTYEYHWNNHNFVFGNSKH